MEEDSRSIVNKVLKYWFREDGEYNGFDLWINKDPMNRLIIDKDIFIRFIDDFVFILEDIEDQPETKKILIDEKGRYTLYDIIEMTRYYSMEERIGLIIMLDQMARHFKRYIENSEESIEIEIPIEETRELSYKYAEYLLTIDEEEIKRLKSDYLIFLLMPIKHKDVNYIVEGLYDEGLAIHEIIYKYVISKGKSSLLELEDGENLNKFYMDTVEKYYKRIDLLNYMYVDEVENNFKEYEGIMDDKIEKYEINKKGIERLEMNRIENVMYKYIKENRIEEVTVSVSGGVDSMVSLYILKKINRKIDFKLGAFHLKYNNREEGKKEGELIERYCRVLGIKYRTFEISGITRRFTNRDFYERLTREIRFKCYKRIGGMIILGHILEDVIENIWNNIAHGSDLFYLKRMREISIIEGVLIGRPLMGIRKDEIIEYAREYYIPYTKNSTPEWSNRGKMRERMRPLMREMWGEDIDNKVMYVSDSLEEYGKYIRDNLLEPFNRGWNIEGRNAVHKIGEERELGLHFWNEVISELFIGKLKEEVPSRRAINNIVDKIRGRRKGKYPLKKGWICNIYITVDGDYIDIERK